MLNWSLLENLLIVAMACSSITVIFIQKTKKFCMNSKCITVYGLLVNLIFGYLFCQTFSSLDYVKSIWVGLFSFLGADTIYKNLEGKLDTYTDLTGKNQNKKDDPISNTSDVTLMNDVKGEDIKTDIIGEIKYE